MTVEPLAYNVDEAADALRVSAGMVRKLIRAGELSASRIGDRVIISRKALETLLSASKE